MSVEELNAPDLNAGVVVTADTSTQVADNDALGAVWDRLERDNGAGRDASTGKFASSSGDAPGDEGTGSEGPLEGGEGEGLETVDTSTPAVKVPLPANWTGLDDHWSKIPPEAQEAIAANQTKLHKTLSDQGRFIAGYKPIADVLGEFKEYFGGERGNYKPDEAVRYLFGLQRAMDENPVETLMQIADSYELRGELAKMFGAPPADGGTQPPQTDHTQALMAEIGQLKKVISGLADPAKIDERINTRLNEDRTMNAVNDVISRVATKDAMPLYGDVEDQLPTFIQLSWRKLGDTASQEAVLKHAYDMAVNADPDLRKKAAALVSAAQTDPKLVENARKANATNIRSTSTGKSREPTEDEALGSIWDKHKRA